jgi:hypothetical protein
VFLKARDSDTWGSGSRQDVRRLTAYAETLGEFRYPENKDALDASPRHSGR